MGSLWTKIIRDRSAVSYLFNIEAATRKWVNEPKWTPDFTSRWVELHNWESRILIAGRANDPYLKLLWTIPKYFDLQHEEYKHVTASHTVSNQSPLVFTNNVCIPDLLFYSFFFQLNNGIKNNRSTRSLSCIRMHWLSYRKYKTQMRRNLLFNCLIHSYIREERKKERTNRIDQDDPCCS